MSNTTRESRLYPGPLRAGRTMIYLTITQKVVIDKIKGRYGISMAAIVRNALDIELAKWLEKLHKDEELAR